MDIPLDKVIPRVLALAVVGYCLWPSFNVFFTKPREKMPTEIPELSASLLSPKMPPPASRDPFTAGPTALAANENGGPKNAIEEKQNSKPAKPSRVNPITDPKLAKFAGGSVRPDGPMTSRGEDAKPPVLEATYIVNDQRLAVINGRLYAPSDKIAVPGVSGTPCEIIDVQPYKVLLKCGEKTAELSFSNTSASSAANASRGGRLKKKTTTATKRTLPKKRQPPKK